MLNLDIITKNLQKRKKQESRFRRLGAASIVFSLSFLAVLFLMIFLKGYGAFFASKIAVEVDLSRENLVHFLKTDITTNNQSLLENISYRKLVKDSLAKNLNFPQENSRDGRQITQLISKRAYVDLEKEIVGNQQYLGTKKTFWLTASSKADTYLKHGKKSSLSQVQVKLLEDLQVKKQVKQDFNLAFFTSADSREAEMAGIAASIIGTLLTGLIFLTLAFPMAVMCAIYLEEFAPKNTFTDIIEVSINNLAAIPSIIYGLLGLSIYLHFLNVPRSSSLVGGLTLFLLVLPVIAIATRNAIRSIPSSIRDGAMAIGASKMQVVLHHILPLSMPGIMTGTILAVSRAIGETAPLLMIGMVAFIADKSANFTDPTTVLPVQIYLWSDSPELGFAEKTAAAIIVLLALLILFNSLAVFLRKKYEVKW